MKESKYLLSDRSPATEVEKKVKLIEKKDAFEHLAERWW